MILEDVRKWSTLKFPVWLEEKPEWFNEQKMSVIFVKMVEDKELLRRIRTARVNEIRSKRRRSSFRDIQVVGGEKEEQRGNRS